MERLFRAACEGSDGEQRVNNLLAPRFCACDAAELSAGFHRIFPTEAGFFLFALAIPQKSCIIFSDHEK